MKGTRSEKHLAVFYASMVKFVKNPNQQLTDPLYRMLGFDINHYINE